MKKLLCVVLSLLLVCGLFTFAAAEEPVIPITAEEAEAVELPFAPEEAPCLTGVEVADGQLVAYTSEDLTALCEANPGMSASIGVSYFYEGEYFNFWHDNGDGVYDPATGLYTLPVPEGAESVEARIVLNLGDGDLFYYYSIDSWGVYALCENIVTGEIHRFQYGTDYVLTSYSTDIDGSTVDVYFDENGMLESYSMAYCETGFVSFWPDGTVRFATYMDPETFEFFQWNLENGWHTSAWDPETEELVITPVEMPEGAVDPETLEPLVIVIPPIVMPEKIWYPNNTLGLAGVSLKDLGISNNWRNVLPVDLTQEGTTAYTLVGSDCYILGTAYVTVAEGSVTVTYKLMYGEGYIQSEKLNWFLTRDELSDEALKADSAYAFGVPVSIADELGGAEMAILFIDSRITYRQPYFNDFDFAPTYWRNMPTWKSFRNALIQMLGE